MPEPTAEQIEKAQDLLTTMAELCDGYSMAMVLCAIQDLSMHSASQAHPDMRAVHVKNLREQADILEAMDAPKH